MAKLAFLGLGVMGYPMAGHLQKKGGHQVTVYNRTGAKAQQWAGEFGGQHAASPREAAKDCDFVMLCVGNDDDVRSVAYGDNGALAGMRRGAILVDHTTASALLAKELFAKAKERGVGFIDAPVSGGQDRKSTRLNSSHSQISYAVFCLKKKKKRKCTVPIKDRLRGLMR